MCVTLPRPIAHKAKGVDACDHSSPQRTQGKGYDGEFLSLALHHLVRGFRIWFHIHSPDHTYLFVNSFRSTRFPCVVSRYFG